MRDFKRLDTVTNHTGGAGADSLTGGAGANTFVQNNTDGVDASAFAGAVGTFDNGVDVVEDFSDANGDVLQIDGGLSNGDDALINATAADDLGTADSGDQLALQGNWAAGDGQFTIADDGTDVLVATITSTDADGITDLDDAIVLVGGVANYDAGTTIVDIPA